MDFILIAGMPASGKTTIANKIGKTFGYPILEKDAIKEELFDIIGFNNYQEKRRLDDAATSILIRCADALLHGNTSLICVNNFKPDSQEKLEAVLSHYSCRVVTVFLGGDTDVFYKRYVERDNRHARHLGHVLQDHYPPRPGDVLDYSMTRDEFYYKFENLGMADFKIKGSRIEIDATYPEKIDMDALIKDIRKELKNFSLER